MADLPAARVNKSFPFQHVGIDFAGPLEIKQSSLRNAKRIPVYICLFICISTKAVHLELVSSLSAEAFLACFKRFVSRRGLCTEIYSDCGTNFVKANKLLIVRTEAEKLADKLASDNIRWHFNPPAAPHFGGLWESNIKIAKTHLKRTLQNTNLTFEELYTVLCQIEACINSRPLIPISYDVDATTFLTPGHFLIHRNLKTVPESNGANHDNPTKKWQQLKQLQKNFWQTWSREYLLQLQQRNKWKHQSENLNLEILSF